MTPWSLSPESLQVIHVPPIREYLQRLDMRSIPELASSSSPPSLTGPLQLTGRLPLGVREIISSGGCIVGLYDQTPVVREPNKPLPPCTKVLKYTRDENDRNWLISIKVEARILDILDKLGPHPSIMKSEGLTEDGLVLKYYPNGNMGDYLIRYPEVSLEIRLDWCQQLVAAVSFIHSKNVIHCTIDVSNILLDINLNIILADFQGILKNSAGEYMLDGLSREGSKSSMPRPFPYHAEKITDIFAVGSAMYHIITGGEVFPELDSVRHAVEVQYRFRNTQFPRDDYVCSHIIEKCWRGLYSSIDEVSEDIFTMQSASWAGDVAQKLEDGFFFQV
ncbi:hypothetical protein PENANT_c018G01467 [Penicillium antarcticum]|uniref:Protein kinase domain-containing protein n=1 Tax=Penicillium antarcticum TaxID=416450 RepID=A0A1V6Q1Q1_9EURO|nr:uncharacterized protein N7508_003815 [Penicillium antarcticum]KAJ5312985.1 hypothetical protein N7508_003815 [Penicillium antarcticum]OQD83159.1 hypothetical protein PENANT_c018G01467 [Penicillium antarcticum]